MNALTHKEKLERRRRKHGYGVSIRTSKRTFSFTFYAFMCCNKRNLTMHFANLSQLMFTIKLAASMENMILNLRIKVNRESICI